MNSDCTFCSYIPSNPIGTLPYELSLLKNTLGSMANVEMGKYVEYVRFEGEDIGHFCAIEKKVDLQRNKITTADVSQTVQPPSDRSRIGLSGNIAQQLVLSVEPVTASFNNAVSSFNNVVSSVMPHTITTNVDLLGIRQLPRPTSVPQVYFSHAQNALLDSISEINRFFLKTIKSVNKFNEKFDSNSGYYVAHRHNINKNLKIINKALVNAQSKLQLLPQSLGLLEGEEIPSEYTTAVKKIEELHGKILMLELQQDVEMSQIAREVKVSKNINSVIDDDGNGLLSFTLMHFPDRLDVFNYLLKLQRPNDEKLNINKKNHDDVTPIFIAVSLGIIPACELLFDEVVDINIIAPKRNNLLHVAIFNEQFDVLCYLLEKEVKGQRINIDFLNEEVLTPLALAEKQKKQNMVDALKKAGAKE